MYPFAIKIIKIRMLSIKITQYIIS